MPEKTKVPPADFTTPLFRDSLSGNTHVTFGVGLLSTPAWPSTRCRLMTAPLRSHAAASSSTGRGRARKLR